MTALAGPIRTAVRESSLVAVLGQLDTASIRILADAHPRGRSAPAFAVLLDVASWRNPEAQGTPELDAAAAVLRNAGWRVTKVRCGEPTALAWQMLLSGFTSSARTTPVLR
jgi:hypothetical protein